MRKKRNKLGRLSSMIGPESDLWRRGRRSGRNAAVAIICIGLILLAGCGGERKQADAAAAKGLQALAARNPQAAREHFVQALRLCPTLPKANFGMARLYDQYFFDTKAAITYYKRYLDVAALSPDQDEGVEAAKAGLEALEAVDSGRLEDPANAVEDLLQAAYEGRREAFFERVSGEYLHAMAVEKTAPEPLLALFGSFNLGGRPEVVYRMITANQQAAIVLISLKGTGDAGGYVQIALLRGSGEQRNSWHLANYQRLAGAKPRS